MKYVKVYESPNPEFLKGLLEDLHQDGIKTARINLENPTVIEVSQTEKKEAIEIIEADLDIVQSLIDAPNTEPFSVEDENKYLLSVDSGEKEVFPKNSEASMANSKVLALIVFFYILSGVFFVFLKAQSGNWWWILIFFAPLFGLKLLVLKIRTSNPSFSLGQEHNDWILNIKKVIKIFVWFFWIIALTMVFLFFRENDFLWEEIISGNKENLLLILNFLCPIIFIGATLHLYKFILYFEK